MYNIFCMDRKIGIILGVVTLLIFAGGIFLVSRSPEDSSYKVYDEEVVKGEVRHQKGRDDATVTIVEFADFQCLACATADTHVNALLEKYPDQVKLIYRHFPLSQYKNAFIAAEASEAAGAQGKFWEMYDLLFTKQNEWVNENNPKEIFLTYAQELELDQEQFKKALEENTYKEVVDADATDAFRVEVDATPMFFVNNQKAIVPFDRLEEEVLSRLN